MAGTVYSVGQVNTYISRLFEDSPLLSSIMVKGEVSNCRYAASGHIYFTLKDASGTLSCVMFAGRRRGLSFHLEEGARVIVTGHVGVYVKSGSYQLYADAITHDGIGALNEQYELLKKKLEAQGLFDEGHKKKIPAYVRKLGVVTAGTGAAVRDIINITRTRNPHVQITIYPSYVQGEKAAQDIVRGIQALDRLGLDVIIIGRGGGSIEDLWAFNEEIVAEAVYHAATPIISAVGHETDTVITDYVADLRASTPSQGAELAVFDYQVFQSTLLGMEDELNRRMHFRLRLLAEKSASLEAQLRHLSPAATVTTQRMHAARLEEALRDAMNRQLVLWRQKMETGSRLKDQMEAAILSARHRLQLLSSQMESSSPVRRLSGGYGYITDARGRAVISAAQIAEGEEVGIRLKDGRIETKAVRVHRLEET